MRWFWILWLHAFWVKQTGKRDDNNNNNDYEYDDDGDCDGRYTRICN